MTHATGRDEGRHLDGHGERLHRKRGLGTTLAGALALSVAVGVTSAGGAAAAPVCPPGTISFNNTCFPLRFPTATTAPATTPPPTTPPTTAAAPLPPLTPPPVTVPPVVAPTTPVVVREAARRLLDLANEDRRRAGLGLLSPRGDLEAIALDHSQTMARAGDIFHSDHFFGAAVKRLVNASTRGENVAYNTNVDDTHTRLMASPGHRANLLNPRFTTVGFAVVQTPDGRFFTTQNFIQPAGAVPTPAPVAKASPAPKPAAAPAVAVAPPPTTVVPTTLPPTTFPAPPVRLVGQESASRVLSAGVGEQDPAPAVGLAALALLVAAGGACLVVPRRRSR